MIGQEDQWEQLAKVLFPEGFWEGGNGPADSPNSYKIPFSNRKAVSWKQANRIYRFKCGKLSQNIVMVDIDDPEAFECRLKIAQALEQHCVVIQSPKRGGHFFWSCSSENEISNNSGNVTPLTLYPVDYKTGGIGKNGKPKKACAALSTPEGDLRIIRYANFNSDVESLMLDEVPFYDLSFNGQSKKTAGEFAEHYHFLNLKEGNEGGRNQGLFDYMNSMKEAGYTYDQYIEAAGMINRFLFENPLEDKEFETVTRRDAWDHVKRKNKFYNGSSFQHDKFGDYLIQQYHICCIDENIGGTDEEVPIYCYDNGVYVSGSGHIMKIMVNEISNLKRISQNEVLHYLHRKAPTVRPERPEMIPFKNGLLDIEHFELLPPSPEHVVTNLIPWDYNPSATCQVVDDTLNKISCGDPEIRALLEECGGYCMYRSNKFKRAFMLVGDKNNGKSTYISMLQAMLGGKNVSNLDFREIDSRFSKVLLFGKLANLGDDIADTYKEDISTFKKIVSGDMIEGEEKGLRPFFFRPYVKLIFSANSKPRFNDATSAGMDRFIVIPLEGHFTADDPDFDPDIRNKLSQRDAVEYFIQLALKGLKRVLDNKGFTFSKKAQAEKEDYERENDPVRAFLEECMLEEFQIVNETVSTVYQHYQEFCITNGFRPLSRGTFSKKVNRILGTHSGTGHVGSGDSRKSVKVFLS